jgi:hypothetical protein
MMTESSSTAQSEKEKCYHIAASPAKLPVHIRPDGEVDNEIVNLRRCVGDEIIWSAEGADFTIDFPSTPFEENRFHVLAGESVSSGPVRPDAPIDRFQYFITNVALAKSADPGADIKP